MRLAPTPLFALAAAMLACGAASGRAPAFPPPASAASAPDAVSCDAPAGVTARCRATGADGVAVTWLCGADNAAPSRSTAAPEPVGGLVGVAYVAPSRDHLCARMLDGTVRCVGRNDRGQLAQGDPAARGAPAGASCAGSPVALAVPGLRGVTALFRDDCARLADGMARCWGERGPASWPSPTGPVLRTPTPVADLTAPVRQVAGRCAVLEATGAVQCASEGAGGAPLRGTTGVEQMEISPRGDGGCARVYGRVVCWGANAPADAARGAAPGAAVPVVGLADVAQVGAGDGFACALTADGVACWGRNDVGQLGDGTTTAGPSPRFIEGSRGATHLAVGASQACVRLADRRAECWGRLPVRAADGAVTWAARPSPEVVQGLARVARVAIGGETLCAVTDLGDVRCWGRVYGTQPAPDAPGAASAPAAVAEDYPARPAPPGTIRCTRDAQHCFAVRAGAAAECFVDEDTCLDTRADRGGGGSCAPSRGFAIARAGEGGAVEWSCHCDGAACVAATGDGPCAARVADAPASRADLERACDANLVPTRAPAASAGRDRYCARGPVQPRCQCPPGSTNCSCGPALLARQCFRTSADCESYRASSARVATASACARVRP